jgi:hypothetical protein
MNPSVKVLPSIYRGVRFRSRTEARWAIYFDLIGLKWRYEPEGYELPSGNYCPDFECVNFFVEVKPNALGRIMESNKFQELARMTGKMVFCVVGAPSVQPQAAYSPDGDESLPGIFCHYAFTKKGWEVPYFGGEELDFIDEPYWWQAANWRFENGRG